VVTGSSLFFSDAYIDKEENGSLCKLVLSYLLGEPFDFHRVDADEPDLTDYSSVSCIESIADKPRVCLQRPAIESSGLESGLGGDRMFSVDVACVAPVLNSYPLLGLKHEALRLITPEFETPLPPLQPAVSIPTDSINHCHFLVINIKAVPNSKHPTLSPILCSVCC